MWQMMQAVLYESWEQFVLQTVRVLPNLLAGLLIFLIGSGIGIVAGSVVKRLLVAAQVDRGAARLGLMTSLERVGVSSAATLLSRSLKWFIILLAAFPALYSLDARLASDLIGRIVAYLPHLAVGTAFLWVGILLGRFLGRGVLIASVNAGLRSARALGATTRLAVVLVALAAALEHLGIGRATVLTAFSILFGGATFAAALAIGLGSQDLVRRWLTEWFDAGRQRQDEEAIRHL